MEAVIDATRKEHRIYCPTTGKQHDIQVVSRPPLSLALNNVLMLSASCAPHADATLRQIGVAILNKMNAPGLCDASTSGGCARAAEEYATSV